MGHPPPRVLPPEEDDDEPLDLAKVEDSPEEIEIMLQRRAPTVVGERGEGVDEHLRQVFITKNSCPLPAHASEFHSPAEGRRR